MDYSVTLRRALIDDVTGVVLAPAGAVGIVQTGEFEHYTVEAGPPGAVPKDRSLQWRVMFGAQIAPLWVNDTDLLWNAGQDARLDALIKGRTVEGVGLSQNVSSVSPMPIALRLQFDNGLNITLVASQTTGMLAVQLDADGV